MTFFLESFARQSQGETITDGLRELVVAYYDEYSEADEIDFDTLRTLRVIEELADTVSSHVAPMSEIIVSAEKQVREYKGRNVRTESAWEEVEG